MVAVLPIRHVLPEDGRVKSNGWKDGSIAYNTMIGIDLAKNVFQLYGALLSGEVKFRRKLSLQHFRRFMAGQGASIVVMEACGSGHYWSREMTKVGHEVRPIAPQHVCPFAPEERCRGCRAIVTAEQRPEMRFACRNRRISRHRRFFFAEENDLYVSVLSW